MVAGTQSENIIDIVNRIPLKQRLKVTEVTLDMANSMNKVVKKCFPNAIKVIDRFHVQKLAYDALQEIRIEHRWDAINEETNAIENAQIDKYEYIAQTLENGDTKNKI